jgi:methyltransferase (TIGR00027 family)
VFEVDHPSTQEWKRTRLDAAGIAVPEQTRFVPVNFERQALEKELEACGFRMGERAFFSCLGVVPYLTWSTFSGTITYIARLALGSGVVFDYAVSKTLLSPREQLRLEALAGRVAAAGEPLRLFFEPGELAQQLRQLGFRDLEDLDSAAINAR